MKQLIEISQYYGKNPEMVIAGGGNTSYKTNDHIWVKASGHALATIDANGFAMLDRELLQEISEKNYSSEPLEREQQIKEDLSKANLTPNKRPSVETSLHEIINYSYVVHLHPTLVNGAMCSKNAEKTIHELFSDEVIYVEYIDPGYTLFKEVEKRIEIFVDKKGHNPKVIFLQNHGVFVGADSINEIKMIYEDMMARFNNKVNESPDLTSLPLNLEITNIVPAIRMMLSESDQVKTVITTNNKLVQQFIKSETDYSKINKPFTPDIIVYCKSNYIYINKKGADAIIEDAQKKITEFRQQYGYPPKVILIKDIGLIAIGDHHKQAQTITDVFTDMMKISVLSESFGGQNFMTEKQIEFIDNWEVENYRRKVAAQGLKEGRVQNKTIIVTGAAMGFGEGIATGLFKEGANIVVADMNVETGMKTAEKINNEAGNNKAVFIETNVADETKLNELMLQTVSTFGGIDAFVSNAGILRAGGLDEMELDTFDLVTKINYNAYFYCTKIVSKIMKLQTAYADDSYFADILQINSKSGLKGSKKNFAYAGGKFGGIGLTQSFALELAPERIKVNSICPGNYYEGPLWSDPENGLFIQYLNAGKVPGAKTIEDVKAFYLSQVPLGKGCTPDDVVKAALYLIEQKNETGQALPVSGGQQMLR